MFGLSFKEKDSLFFFFLLSLPPEVVQHTLTQSLKSPPRVHTLGLQAQTSPLSPPLLGCPVETRQKFPAEKMNPVVCLILPSRIRIRAHGQICLPPSTHFFFFFCAEQSECITDGPNPFPSGVVTGLTICAHCCAE